MNNKVGVVHYVLVEHYRLFSTHYPQIIFFVPLEVFFGDYL